MPKVYEIRDVDGVRWALYSNEEAAIDALPLLDDVPTQSLRICQGEITAREYLAEFGYPAPGFAASDSRKLPTGNPRGRPKRGRG